MSNLYPSLLSDCNDGSPCNMYAPLTACAPYQEDDFKSGFKNWISSCHDKSPATSIATNENPSGKNNFSWVNDDDDLLSANNIIGDIYDIIWKCASCIPKQAAFKNHK